MSKDSTSLSRLRAEMQAFRAGFNNLFLATVSPTSVPEASAMPMVAGDAGEFYIYVSALSRHTSNLESNPQAGVLLIQDEQSAPNAFARERLSYQCQATRVERDSQRFNDIMQVFGRRFGSIVETLQNLPDFQLICLTPVSGTYVRGFAQAWRLSGPGLDDLQHLNPARDG
jgi:putative heme iron utilization protein